MAKSRSPEWDEKVVNDAISEKRPESSKLEFKEKEDSTKPRLSKQDRRNLGKALSGFSNADGGTLIFGIGTEKSDGIDVAAMPRPIAQLEKFRSSVEVLIGEILRPEHTEIRIEPIYMKSDSSAGYLAIYIGPSENRPHMSLAPDHQKYFRRGLDSTRPMDHGEIRDMMFAPRQPMLTLHWTAQGFSSSASSQTSTFNIPCHFFLENVGRAAAVAPYVRVRTSVTLNPTNSQHFQSRRRRDGSTGFYSSRDIVLHAGDEMDAGSMTLTARILLSAMKADFAENGETAIENPDHWYFVSAIDANNFPPTSDFPDPFALELILGAENAPVVTQTIEYSKNELAQLSLSVARSQVLKLMHS